MFIFSIIFYLVLFLFSKIANFIFAIFDNIYWLYVVILQPKCEL